MISYAEAAVIVLGIVIALLVSGGWVSKLFFPRGISWRSSTFLTIVALLVLPLVYGLIKKLLDLN